MPKTFQNKISNFRNVFTGTLPGGTSCINSNLVRKPKREKNEILTLRKSAGVVH